MNSNIKFFVRILAVLLAIGSVAMVAVRQSELADLRAEQLTLLKDSQEADRLAIENREIDKLRADNEEVKKLRVENNDLPKLRNEVRKLRKQLDEMAALKAENERLMSQPVVVPPERAKNQFARENLRDVGMRLPIMTLQTFFAALNQGNVNRAMECLTPEAAAKLAAEGQNGQQLLQLMNNFTGYQITDRNQPSPDEIDLQVQLTGTGAAQTVQFKLIGNEWKMSP